MKHKLTEELAALYKNNQLPLDGALEKHCRNHGFWPLADDDFLAIQLAIGFANLGLLDKDITLSGDRQQTVAQIIGDFKLAPFLETWCALLKS